MSIRFVADVEDWERRPFDGGVSALHGLADASLSGAVRVGDAYLFFVGGRPIGAFEYRDDGGEVSVSPVDVDRFEDGDSVLVAPHRALPLLHVMQAVDGETRGRYYSNDTPIEEVDRTLREGNFTGYLELSENVLSGDYYLLYHRGKRQPVAFVGQSERLKTEDEAYELATDEVGIYEVVRTDLPRIELPDPPESSVPRDPIVPKDTDEDEEAEESTETVEEPGDGSDEATVEAAIERAEESVDDDTVAEPSDPDPASEFDPTAPAPEPEAATESADEGETDADDTMREETPAEEEPSEPVETEAESEGVEATPEDVAAAAAAVEAEVEAESEADDIGSEEVASATNGEAVTDDHVVPSVDPDRTARGEPSPSGEPAEEELIVDGETVSGLRKELSARGAELESLREELEEVAAERDALRDRIEELERRLAAAGAAPEEPSRTLSATEALAGTSLFVRYRSKRQPTLRDVHDGEATPEAVSENLRLERHTQFDAEAVAVEGRSFEAFLKDTQAYGFVTWLVEELPYELRDTGNTESMGALYDALPELDRIEFGGEVSVGGEAVRFDVVGRDRLGTPLLVATLEDGRDPTDEVPMAELVNTATDLARENESLAGAFAVTASYFEPSALETADEATGGSLLSRDRRKAFVKLSRKRGFHLCLVEDREASFYLSMPEL